MGSEKWEVIIMNKNLVLSIKNAGKVIFLYIVVFAPLIFGSGKVSFDVPTDHEKFPLIDSLYNSITRLDETVKKMERQIVKNKSVLAARKFAAKEKYFDFLLEEKAVNSKRIIKLCELMKELYQVQMTYFQEMLPLQKDNLRSKCFALFRHARDNYAAAQNAIFKYSPEYIDLSNE